jgi:hypothetical protein
MERNAQMKAFATQSLLWIYYTVLIAIVIVALPAILLVAILTDADKPNQSRYKT